MKKAAFLSSMVGLALTVFPAVLVFYGVLQWRTHTHLMFAGMLLWFVFAPLWMRAERR